MLSMNKHSGEIKVIKEVVWADRHYEFIVPEGCGNRTQALAARVIRFHDQAAIFILAWE